MRITTAIGGGGTFASTTARMYSMPVIVAPAAAVGTGSCQTRVRLRLVSGLSLGEGLGDVGRVGVLGEPQLGGAALIDASRGEPPRLGAGRRAG